MRPLAPSYFSAIRRGALLLLGMVLGATCLAQPANNTPPPSASSSPTPERTSSNTVAPGTRGRTADPNEERLRSELLDSYQFLREQLYTTQAAIAAQRLDAQEAARRQASEITTQLEAMKHRLTEMNERQREDTFRLEYRSQQQQEETRRSQRSLFWIAGVVGGALLLTLVVMARLQSQAIHRIAHAVHVSPDALEQTRLGAWSGQSPTSIDVGETSVEAANQRLAAAVEKIERRIGSLEQTARGKKDPEQRVYDLKDEA
ncbi:MAG TPA: hypothetical protein PLN52_17080 [Opitutaceae bacterium]|nr:hypothetical protein [Opitutaceae bacterium]